MSDAIEKSEDQSSYHSQNRISAQGRVQYLLDKGNIDSMIYQVHKCILSQSTDPFNGQTKYYWKIYTFDLSQKLPIKCVESLV